MKLTYTSVFSYLRVAVAGTLVLAAVALAVTTAKMSTSLQQAEKRAYTPQKHEADLFKPGTNAETARGPNESRNPDSSPDVEEYMKRAYPADEVSMDLTIAAQNGWKSLSGSAQSPGTWHFS